MTSILDEAKEMDQVKRENYLIKAFIIGESGSGKSTSAALTLPGKKLFLDYDMRGESLAGYADVKVIQFPESNPRSPSAWDKAEKVKDLLWMQYRAGKLEYQSIIEDGLSSMNRICMYWALLLDPKRGLGGSPAKQHYGPHIKNLQDHIISMISLPVNYVLTGHFNHVKDEETGGIKYLPKVYGEQFRTDLPGMFNEVYLTYHATDEKSKHEKYYWHTSGFGRYDFMKSSLNQLGKYWDDPVEIDLDEAPAGFNKLLMLRFDKGEPK